MSKTLKPETDRPLLTVDEVAKLLKVCTRTVYRLKDRSGLRCIRFGNRVRFDPDDVSKWVSARKEG